jgi:hypothetical protein
LPHFPARYLARRDARFLSATNLML